MPGAVLLPPFSRRQGEIDFFRRMLVVWISGAGRKQADADGDIFARLQAIGTDDPGTAVPVAKVRRIFLAARPAPPAYLRCEIGQRCRHRANFAILPLGVGQAFLQMFANRHCRREHLTACRCGGEGGENIFDQRLWAGTLRCLARQRLMQEIEEAA